MIKLNILSHNKPCLLYNSLIVIFLMCSNLPSSRCQDYLFKLCSRHYECGHIKGVSFPFWGEDRPQSCGRPGFKLRCYNNQSIFEIQNHQYQVHNISQSSTQIVMRITLFNLKDGPCPSNLQSLNTTNDFKGDPTLLEKVENLTLYYGCPQANLGYSISCTKTAGGEETVFYATDSFPANQSQLSELFCNDIIRVPILRTALDKRDINLTSGERFMKVSSALKSGFNVVYGSSAECQTCERSGGKCGFDNVALGFPCFCRDGRREFVCSASHGILEKKLKVAIGILAGAILTAITSIMVCYFRNISPSNLWSRMTKKDQDIEAFLKSNGHLPVKRYRFSDVKKMTKFFKDKLGQGGYGEVYKGKLHDGRFIAVKLLKSSKGNGEEFVNEVASISRTSHVNIVTLLGFCVEGTKRALIYEFMPNGSLEKFVYNYNASQTNLSLACEKLLKIAIGIARGLEYLHRGCSTKILHLDIKPHNILLNEDFCPKISDFGLAKLCPPKESIISLMGARGTIGYVALEVFNRNFGGVSSKSDVYSYGMMILEMVVGRKNINIEASNSSEIYFPDWIYKHLEHEDHLQLWNNMTSEENRIAKKLILVGLWCIQTFPSGRPSTSKVIEMLEGSLESLPMPPKPTFSSPRSLHQSLAQLVT